MKWSKFLQKWSLKMRMSLFMIFAIVYHVKADYYSWRGGISGNHWSDAANWTVSGGASTDYPGQNRMSDIVVIISTNGHNDPVLNVSVAINSLTINQSASLYNDGLHNLTTSGDVVIGPNSGNSSASLKLCAGTSGTDLIVGGSISGYGNLYMYGTGQTVQIANDMTVAGFIPNHAGHFGSTVDFNGTVSEE